MTLRAFTMPKWGIEMQEGAVAQWLVAEGETFKKGQLIALIETDKINNEVEAETPGVMLKQVAALQQTLPVGALLAVFGDEGDDGAAAAAFAQAFKPAESSAAAALAKSAAPAAAAPPPKGVTIPADLSISPEARRLVEAEAIDLAQITGSGRDGRITLQDVQQAVRPPPAAVGGAPIDIAVGTDALDRFYASPLAKRLALQHRIDLAQLTGTGPRGRIGKGDVMAQLAQPAAALSPGAPEILPMSRLRKIVARRLTEAKTTIPHFYLRAELRVDALTSLRATANLVLGCQASLNDYLVRAAALALIEVPDVNIQLHGDTIHRFGQADIAIAVASERGLVTPILFGADRLKIPEIALATKALVKKAQAGRLTTQDLEGGSFTISNLGMMGVDQFDAIINPPQGAILAVGTQRRVWGEGADGSGRFESRISVSLSCDHRAIDGATGARFLTALRKFVEQPTLLF